MVICLAATPLAASAATRGGEGPQSRSDTLTFVVLGHLRGDRTLELHYLLEELLSEVGELDPDFAVLTGDVIWGNPQQTPADRASVLAQWEALDSALARLDIPIYRVPGNHEISDQVTYELFVERYGPLPAAIDHGPVRLLLLNSAWPADEGAPRAVTRGYDLDSAQIRFARERLAEAGDSGHAFVFVHHLLWWGDAGSSWWREVHPELVAGGARAVFSGDYGPEKFSHTRQDGIDYYQSSIAPPGNIEILRGHEWNRILAQQFDNFLVVRLAGTDVEVEVRTIGETTTGHFTPDHWRAVFDGITRPPTPTGRDHLVAVWERPKGRLAILGGLGLAGIGGLVIGLLIASRRRRAG
jgi:3',5'-cyclic AMP phosphodiesterase CpdA